jgi:hypothetical protein
MTGDGRGDVWAITAYFDPIGYRSRLANYRAFRRHLTVPLLTVELAYRSAFDLKPDDADVLIQLRGGAVLWQKERLLNLAVRALPDACRTVAWLDGDILFERGDWHLAADQALERHKLVQLFRFVHRLRRDARLDRLEAVLPDYTMESLACRMLEGTVPPEIFWKLDDTGLACSAGFAWACRREMLERLGLYDTFIVGGADRATASAAFGHSEGTIPAFRLNPRWAAHYRAWAAPFFAAVRADVGFVDGTIWHLWHGERTSRRYVDRHMELEAFDFDPCSDIALSDQGCWRWGTDKSDLHDYVRRYFQARREDG